MNATQAQMIERDLTSPFARTDFHPRPYRAELTEEQIADAIKVLHSLTAEQVKAVRTLVKSATELGADRGWEAAQDAGATA